MEKWHKIGIFVVGLIGLVLYLYSSVKETKEEIEKDHSRKKKELKPLKDRLKFYVIFMAGCILCMFTVPRLLEKIIVFLFPDPERTSMEIIFKFLEMLVYLGERHFDNEGFFFEGKGMMLLEWLFVLLPYIIGFVIWSIKMLVRN